MWHVPRITCVWGKYVTYINLRGKDYAIITTFPKSWKFFCKYKNSEKAESGSQMREGQGAGEGGEMKKVGHCVPCRWGLSWCSRWSTGLTFPCTDGRGGWRERSHVIAAALWVRGYRPDECDNTVPAWPQLVSQTPSISFIYTLWQSGTSQVDMN